MEELKNHFLKKELVTQDKVSSKPPHFRGGATSMGPTPRDHSFSINKKEKKLALKSALSSKLFEDEIIILDKLEVGNS